MEYGLVRSVRGVRAISDVALFVLKSFGTWTEEPSHIIPETGLGSLNEISGVAGLKEIGHFVTSSHW